MTDYTERVLDIFSEIARIPRPSKKEERIGKWLRERAEKNGWKAASDEAGNVVITVPASAGRESEPRIILQGHQDMVCEKRPEVQHDFERDPIRLVHDGEWLSADGTTLGADNGIAIALAIALAEDPGLSRPPLELLFTVDEETGLTGAQKLDPALLSGQAMINIDSEDEGVFTVGCAGGRDVRVKLPVRREEAEASSSSMSYFAVRVSGLRGGHSGIDIRKRRGNANAILARLLRRIAFDSSVRIVSFSGGNAHNAIPRDAMAVCGCPNEYMEAVRDQAARFECEARDELGTYDPGLRIEVTDVPSEHDPGSGASSTAVSASAGAATGEGAAGGVGAEDARGHASGGAARASRAPLAPEDARKLINAAAGLPHGVVAMSPEIAELVETSVNFAVAKTEDDHIELQMSQRSSVQAALDALTDSIAAVADLAGAEVRRENEYPGWEPNLASPLLSRAQEAYREEFAADPTVEAIHAGLECGVIGSKLGGLDMLSIGPTIEAPHSPDERLHVPSVDRLYRLLARLLAKPVFGVH